MRLLKLLFLILIIICILLIICNKNIEYFSNVPLLVYYTELNSKKINIYMDKSNYSDIIKNKISDIKNLDISSKKTNNNNTLICTDTLSYNFIYQNNKILTITNDQKYALFIKQKDKISNESLKNIIVSNKSIGYINDIDLIFLKYLCISLGLDYSLMKIKKVLYPKIINNNYFKENNIYTLFIFITLSNIPFIKLFDNNFIVDFIQYEDFDIDKIKFLMPYVKIINTDLVISFPKFKDQFSIKTCCTFDMILCGNDKLENDNDLGLELNKIIIRFENFELINYYSIYFTLYKQTIKYMYISNKHIEIRDNLSILEQFSLTPTPTTKTKEIIFNINVNNNLEGYYNDKTKILLINVININEIPLTLYSRIVCTNQDRIEENGTYFVKNIKNDPISLSGSTVLQKYIIYRNAQKLKIVNGLIDITNITNIENIPINEIIESDNIYIPEINSEAHIIKLKNKLYLKIIENDKENPTYDLRYECYNNIQIKSRGLCESKYDVMGNPKKKLEYWDRRCENNNDCPFYQSNKNYKNYNGGCIDGYCQMPLGIKPVSYRKYDKSSKAFCHNCHNSQDPFCCEDQKDRIKYSNLKSPDYAFQIDMYDRMKELKNKSVNKWYNN